MLYCLFKLKCFNIWFVCVYIKVYVSVLMLGTRVNIRG